MNIRYPIYEGVYRILTIKETDYSITNHLTQTGQLGTMQDIRQDWNGIKKGQTMYWRFLSFQHTVCPMYVK